MSLFIKKHLGLPWWCSAWESACQCRGHGFEPWSGKIPRATEQLGPWATTTEPARLEPALCNKRGRDSERPAHRDEEWPPLAATRESPRTETKTQHSQKKQKAFRIVTGYRRHFLYQCLPVPSVCLRPFILTSYFFLRAESLSDPFNPHLVRTPKYLLDGWMGRLRLWYQIELGSNSDFAPVYGPLTSLASLPLCKME